MDDATWTAIDGRIDTVLTAVRKANPDPGAESSRSTICSTRFASLAAVMHRDDLLGTWLLLSWTAEADGELTHPLGIDPVGTIIYTRDGYMSAQLMRRDRTAYVSAWPGGGTPEQLAAAASGYLAYSGPFTLDESTGVVHHRVEVSLLPNWIGGVQDRHGQLDGTTLTLSADATSKRGVTSHSILTWRRAVVEQ